MRCTGSLSTACTVTIHCMIRQKEGLVLKKNCKIISYLLVIVMSFICVTTVMAVQLYTDGDYTYADVDSNNVALFDYSGESDVLTVPAYFSNKAVSQIYEYAFDGNTAISQIDFSENNGRLSVISTKAFNDCVGLSGTLTLPSSIRRLGYGAFQGCTGLDTLYLNLGLREVPEQCFNRCTGLRVVYLPTELESIERLAFGNCNSLEKVFIPNSVTYIHNYAFSNSHPVLYVYYESYAQEYAISHGFNYVIINPPVEPTEAPTEEPTEAPTEEPTEVPTEAPTEIPTELSGYYLGDADGNGFVESIDTTLLQRRLANVPVYVSDDVLIHGDVDRSGAIEIVDATFIMRYLATLPTPYAIGELVES